MNHRRSAQKITPNPTHHLRKVRSRGDIEAKMHYFFARHFEGLENESMQMQHLERAVAAAQYPPLDVLIAMYELTADKEWRESTQRRIAEADTLLRAREEKLRAQLENLDGRDKRRISNQLVRTLNELAWLAVNTDGDIELAKQDVAAALEIEPDNVGCLDTLARCYFVQGAYDIALEYQKQAISLAPHLPQLLKSLREIENAIGKSK